MKLQIDFVSQQGNQHRNDCGAACVAMLTGSSIDDVLLVANQPPNKPLHVRDIMAVLRAYRLPSEYVRPLHLPDLRGWLDNGNPVIALVGYGELPPDQRATDFDGAHWVLVVGHQEETYLVHDPLWPGQAGAYRCWKESVLGAAMLWPGNNMPLQGVVVKRPFVVTEEAKPETRRPTCF